MRTPPCVPTATTITSTTGLKLPNPPTDVSTCEGPSGWCCSQQQERWLDKGCACSGGTHGCDGELGHSLAEDKSRSSHFATGTELRQDAGLGTILPMHRQMHPHHVEQHPGHRVDWETTMKTSRLGSIWGP